jgi:uroporphyrinogen-III synthase
MGAGGPLVGRRIVVTRARERGGELVAKLEALGAEVVSLPAIEIAPPESWEGLDAALRDLSGYQWLVFTSANGALAVRDRLAERDAAERGAAQESLRRMKVAAVGPATARAAAELGCAGVLVAEEHVAEGLAQALREQVRGERVLLVRAEAARDVIPEALRAAGAEVEIAVAYRTLIPAEGVAAVREVFGRGGPDTAVFASSSAVRNFLALLERAGVERPPELRAVSIGPITSGTLREAGWEPAAEARMATLDGLAAACVGLSAG